jgi:hypothetical protein
MFLKYRTNLVEFNEEENTYSLIQKPYTILDLEDNFVKPEVISFDFGTIVKSKKKTGTKKETTKKKLIIEDEEIQEEQPEMETTTVRPRIQGDGTIIWDDADYAKLWERLPFAYKNALAMDREWLQESMDKYIQNRKNKKPSTFVAPSNLILPPQILEDGSYDFGNAIYNKYFNKLDNNYKKTLLTLYTEEDGMKSYKPLLTTLSNIIGGELGFREFF